MPLVCLMSPEGLAEDSNGGAVFLSNRHFILHPGARDRLGTDHCERELEDRIRWNFWQRETRSGRKRRSERWESRTVEPKAIGRSLRGTKRWETASCRVDRRGFDVVEERVLRASLARNAKSRDQEKKKQVTSGCRKRKPRRGPRGTHPCWPITFCPHPYGLACPKTQADVKVGFGVSRITEST